MSGFTFVNQTRRPSFSAHAHLTEVVPQERRPSHGMHRQLGVSAANPTNNAFSTAVTPQKMEEMSCKLKKNKMHIFLHISEITYKK